jgi:uncharacterized damage-inducible protein DinB
MATPNPEPWMRGPIEGVPFVVMPLFFTFAQVREDLARHTEGLSTEQLWRPLKNNAPLGFHLRHIGGSVDRLLTYLEGRQLTEDQLAALREEAQPGAELSAVLNELYAHLESAEQRLREVDVSRPDAPRAVGRLRLPSTVLGLLVHISEHTQRHLGQAITTAKLLRA